MAESEDLIPESLLAIAKDSRYIQECCEVVVEIWHRWCPRQRRENLERDAWFWSLVLYIVLVVGSRGRTLGMEALGLSYINRDASRTSSSFISRFKLLSTSLGLVAAVYLLQSQTSETDATRERVENLTGSSRRDFFEAQRRAMIQRSRQPSSDSSETLVRSQSMPMPASLFLAEWKQKAKQLVQGVAKALLPYNDLTHGPHDLPDQHSQSESPSQTIATWLIRFHLGLYCLNGRYPSWLHRILGHQLHSVDPQSSRLVNKPTSVRIVGLLLLSQSAAAALLGFSRVLLRWWIDTRDGPSLSTNVRGSSIKFIGARHSAAHNPGVVESNTSCAICRQPRRHPACPVTCGHCFCWSCLQSWIMTRGECPLCRVKCTPSQVLALYRYAPATPGATVTSRGEYSVKR